MAIALYLIVLLINIYLSVRRKNYTIILIISIAILSLLSGYARAVSGDLYYYKIAYELHRTITWEVGYLWLSNLFISLGISFEAFHTIVSALSMLFTVIGLKAFTNNKHLILALHTIVMFQFMAIAMRFSIAVSIVLLGFRFLFDDDKKKNLIYFAFVAIATLFHVTALFSALFFLAVLNKQPRKTLRRVLVIVNCIGVMFILLMMIAPSISTYLSRFFIGLASFGSDSFSEMTAKYMTQGYSRSYALYSFLYLLFYICAWYSLKSIGNSDHALQDKTERMDIIFLISMVVMPTLVFDRSIVRMQFWGIYICFAIFGTAYEMLSKQDGRVRVSRIALKPKQHLGVIYIVSFIWFRIMYIAGGLGFDIFQFLNNNLLFS